MRYKVGIIFEAKDSGKRTKEGDRKLIYINDGYKIDSCLVPVDLDIGDMIGKNFLDF